MSVPVKLYLHHAKETVIRRFRGTYDWNEFSSILNHFWAGSAPRSLQIEYVDDENDTVRIASACEWEECLHLYSQSGTSTPLRLHVRRVAKSEKKDAKPSRSAERQQDEEEDEHVTESQTVPASSAEEISVPTPQAPSTEADATLNRPVDVAEQPQERASVPPLPLDSINSDSINEAIRTVPQMSARTSSALRVLSLIFECNAEEELTKDRSDVNFGWCVNVAQEGNETHVDVNIRAIQAQALAKAERLIEAGNFSAADDLLKALIGIVGSDARAVRLAGIAAAQLGNTQEALGLLAFAVESGVPKEELRHDNRLRPLFALSEFVNIVGRDAPKQLGLYPKAVEQFQAIFPHVPEDEVIRRINDVRGDVRVAIERMLSTV